MASAGRKAKMTGEDYVRAVRKCKSMSDGKVAAVVGLNRSNVYRFRNNPSNKEWVDKAKEFISNGEGVNFFAKEVSKEQFLNMPVIHEWIDAMNKKGKGVGAATQSGRLNALYKVCKYLKTSPENLTVDQVCNMHHLMKTQGKALREAKEKGVEKADLPPRPYMAYSVMRGAVRSFFVLVLEISGEVLAAKGMDMSATAGAGKHAKERVTPEQRAGLYQAIKAEFEGRPSTKGFEELYSFELINFCYFGYYTGTRKTGILYATCNHPLNKYTKNRWSIHLIDKGSLPWDKVFIGDALEKLKAYSSKKFNIPIDELEQRMPSVNSSFFPMFKKRSNWFVSVLKGALKRVGKITSIPTHIWRHTFAQDFLEGSEGQYEACASVGGWLNTGILKKHYGKMSEAMQERALRKSMGMPVDDVEVRELKW